MNPDNNPNKKESFKILIPVAALVVCLAIGLIAYMMLRKPDNAQPAAVQETAESEVEQTDSDEPVQSDSMEKQNEPDRDPESDADIDQEDTSQDTNETSVNESVAVDTITDQTSIGDYVLFGSYEQDNNYKNGKEPIEWLVLDEEDSRYLLITSEVIDEACYNNVWEPTAWKDSSLRKWLNSSFLEEAFSEEQLSRLVNKKHANADGDATSDRVFIMDREELEDYFDSNNARTAGATPYAEAQGVYEYSNNNCWWWVREAGADPHYAKYVNCEGAILEYGMLVFNNAFGVRPAIWVGK